ncbi:MAG: hypothetical protein CVU44_15810 [Chloroflexi bacterium HGW-Chloroflexi-6]|nr:MAG: hypothetical protein CVU44_15810 [Chloroflexi bacterium HGW-Chloroflexi-6]
MLNVYDAEVARKVKERLEAEMPIKRILVYGSRARGDSSKWSDLDLYLELSVPITSELRKRIREIAWEVGLEMDIIITTLVRQKSLTGQPILRAIELDGVAV